VGWYRPNRINHEAHEEHEGRQELRFKFRYVSEAIPRGGAITAACKIALEAYRLATSQQLARKINEGLHQRPEARFFRADERDRRTDIPELLIRFPAYVPFASIALFASFVVKLD